MSENEKYLDLLAIFHYIVAGVMAFFSCFPVIHLVIGILFIVAPDRMVQEGETPPPEFFGWIFALVGGFFILLGWTFATCIFIAGRNLKKRRKYMFCLVISCILCVFLPLGTVLGVFTLIVLLRDPVKELFEGTPVSISHGS